jgi:predicted transcriptional regulator
MKKKEERKLSPQDKKIVDVFTELGMPKNLAKTLIYISQVGECRSSEIERGANLRQPEVSVAMQKMTDNGWVSKTNRKKEGKGRPIYIYRLETPIEEIVNQFEQEKTQEIQIIKQDLSELKDLLKQRE